MRVVAAMASGARGGGAEHLLGLLPALVERGVDVLAWVGGDGPLLQELRELGVRAEGLQLMHSRFDPVALVRLRRRLDAYRPDVVHWHGSRAAFYGAATLSDVSSVYTAHGLSYRKERRAGRRAVFLAAEAMACRSDRVISVSRLDLEELIRKGFVSRSRSHYIPNAIRLERFHSPRDRSSTRAQLGLAPDRFVVGTTSRLVPQKNVALALEAMAGIENSTFVVIGDGPERPALEHTAGRLGLDVRWLGRRDDVPQVLAALDAFVLSSRWEGEPIALLEAMYCGLPCVATETEGARELLEGGAGVLSPNEAVSLHRALLSLRKNPPDLALARRRAAARSFSQMAERVETVLDAACGRRAVER